MHLVIGSADRLNRADTSTPKVTRDPLFGNVMHRVGHNEYRRHLCLFSSSAQASNVAPQRHQIFASLHMPPLPTATCHKRLSEDNNSVVAGIA